jgi:NADH-quinone oxidoreductase subunit I/NAD(P)H-quinone oxidoreductase subunit I
MQQLLSEYMHNIKRSATTIFEGMAVTLSHLVRPPITTQYPDRTLKPMTDLIPERYRGFLWVDLDICISCRLCERYCPIDCIVIEDEKIDKILIESRHDGKPTPKIKDPVRFDINLYKCMYCGLCVEPCPTGAIFFTKEFEGASPDLSDMHLRLVDDQRREQVVAAAREAERKAQAAKEAKAKAKAAAAAAKKAAAETGEKPPEAKPEASATSDEARGAKTPESADAALAASGAGVQDAPANPGTAGDPGTVSAESETAAADGAAADGGQKTGPDDSERKAP